MRPTNSVFPSLFILTVVAGALCVSPARAQVQNFDTTLVYRLVSLEQVGDQLVIQAEGGGVSRLLGPVTATATVTQSTVADPCFGYSAVFDLSVAEGTIQIRSSGQVCPPPTRITGRWWVIGGTGGFAGATGSGIESGKSSFTGNDPVVDRLEGSLSDPVGETPGTPLSFQECVDLNHRYTEAWQEAKECNPPAEHFPQCTVFVESDLICGCGSYVNTRNQRALRAMDAASRAFRSAGCSGYWDCVAQVCPGVYGSSCTEKDGQGVCKDWIGW